MSNGAGIRIDVFHHIELGTGVTQLILQRIDLAQETIMTAIDDKLAEVNARFDALTQKVGANGTAILFQIQQLRDAFAANDPAATQRVLDNLDALGIRIAALGGTVDEQKAALDADDPVVTPSTP